MIDPNAVSTIRVGELSPEPFSLTDNVPHEVGTELKRGTIEGLATFISAFIGSTDGVGFRAISVTDGQTLPTTTQQEFILVGKGTYYNVVGGSTIICTEELNAIVSNGSYWFIGVEIPVNVELAGITQFIRDGFINTTPSEDAVYDALALKANVADSENIANKQNDLTPDGTGTKYPTVDAVNDLKWIKSNESLALAQRKGDVLYGILDQYTGEEMTLSKVTGTPAVDGIIYFQLGAEYFKRNFTYVNILWFGAKSDGITDNTVIIQNAIDSDTKSVYIPTGEFICETTIYLKSNLSIFGDGASSIIKQKGLGSLYPATAFSVNSDSVSSFLENVNISNLQFLGEVVSEGFSEQLHLLTVAGVDNLIISNCIFKGFRGDGILISDWAPRTYSPERVPLYDRHNKNISITNCTFDGVNKDNRQCISILDCDGLFIYGNVFKNSTKQGMPGAIDFEPEWIDAVVRNINVSNNNFNNIGSEGLGGVISFVLLNNTNTTCENFIVSGNTGINGLKPFIQLNLKEQSSNFNFLISNNSSDSPKFLEGTGGNYSIRGMNVIGNNAGVIKINGSSPATAIDLVDSSITGNIFKIASDYQIQLSNPLNVTISSNNFSNYTEASIVIAQLSGTGKNLNIQNNIFDSASYYNIVYSVESGSTTDLNTCSYINNIGGFGNGNFPAWITDDCGILQNSDINVYSFNIQTLPDSFSVGKSMANISGNDTGYPSVGSAVNSATLVTYKHANSLANNSIKTNIYQELHPFYDNGMSEGSYWVRYRQPYSNAWGAWFKIFSAELKANIDSPAFTGTPTAPTASLGTNTTQIATTAFAQGIRPYKVYTALLTQVGTDAPTATVLENTIGAIVWSRTTIGGYFATLSGAFITDKTSVLITNGSANSTYIHGAQVSTSNVNVITVTDGQIDKATIEIRVYN